MPAGNSRYGTESRIRFGESVLVRLASTSLSLVMTRMPGGTLRGLPSVRTVGTDGLAFAGDPDVDIVAG